MDLNLKTSKATTIQFRIPLTGLKQSTNKIYAGIHWTKRRQTKDDVLNVARVFCRTNKTIVSYPVEICYKFVFVSRPLDTLNTAYMAKMFEDALRTLGVLKDDDHRYVTRTILEVFAEPSKKGKAKANASRAQISQKDEDLLEITINSL